MMAKLIVKGKEFDIEILDPKLQELVAPKKKTGYERVNEDNYYWAVDTQSKLTFFQECIAKMNESEEMGQRRYGKKLIQAINVGCMQSYMEYEPRTLKELLAETCDGRCANV